MQCPHCQGEIPPASQFCGICGRNIVQDHSPSLFDIPVSAGAKRIRIGMIVVLNLLLVGAGLAFFRAYLHKRDSVAAIAIESQTPVPPNQNVKVDTASDAQHVRASGDAGISGFVPSAPLDPSNRDNTNSRPVIKRIDAGAVPPSKGRTETIGGQTNPKSKPDAGSAGSSSNQIGTQKNVDAGRVSSPTPSRPTTLVDAGVSRTQRTPEEEARIIRVVASKISRVVASHQGQLGRCYQNAQKITTPNKPVEGTINVQFSIQNDGSAKSVRVSSNSTGSASLGKCLAGLVRRWTFPSSQGDPLDFQWPFEFQAPK